MNEASPLVLTFDPQTVDHLGAKMYSHLPNALAELIANAYDADATKVMIKIEPNGSISITDNGHGMSRDDIRDKYLHIGRNRRLEDSVTTESGLRAVSGKKGLGKLALFGIGRRVELKTTRKGSSQRTEVVLSYDDMKKSHGEYHPAETAGVVDADLHGTAVRLSELKRTSAVDAEQLVASLAKLFNYIDDDFSVEVVGSDGALHHLTREARLAAVDGEFEWNFPEDWSPADEALVARGVTGHVVASRTPLRQGMRGITVYVNGRLANEPEYFDASESSYAYSYLTGYLVIDYLDALDPDVIATDRRAIDWDTDETALLREEIRGFVTRLATDWRRRRNESRKAQTEEALGGTTEDWVSTIKSSEQQAVRSLVESIESDDVEIPADQQAEILKLVREVAPPNAEYAWRHFHEEIRQAAYEPYLAGNYYLALQEALKRFLTNVKDKSGTAEDLDSKVLAAAFGNNAALRVFAKFGGGFKKTTGDDVERGQLQISQGIIAGFRNPLAHEEIRKLHESGAFSYSDCLDALSILSHLMRRLDDATVHDPSVEDQKADAS